MWRRHYPVYELLKTTPRPLYRGWICHGKLCCGVIRRDGRRTESQIKHTNQKQWCQFSHNDPELRLDYCSQTQLEKATFSATFGFLKAWLEHLPASVSVLMSTKTTIYVWQASRGFPLPAAGGLTSNQHIVKGTIWENSFFTVASVVQMLGTLFTLNDWVCFGMLVLAFSYRTAL